MLFQSKDMLEHIPVPYKYPLNDNTVPSSGFRRKNSIMEGSLNDRDQNATGIGMGKEVAG